MDDLKCVVIVISTRAPKGTHLAPGRASSCHTSSNSTGQFRTEDQLGIPCGWQWILENCLADPRYAKLCVGSGSFGQFLGDKILKLHMEIPNKIITRSLERRAANMYPAQKITAAQAMMFQELSLIIHLSLGGEWVGDCRAIDLVKL